MAASGADENTSTPAEREGIVDQQDATLAAMARTEAGLDTDEARGGSLADERQAPAGGSRQLAVVTGASSGIGRELARQFANHSFDLVVAAEDREIEAAADDLRSTGAAVTGVRVDLATSDGVEELARRIEATGRPVDVLAVNAGVGVSGRFAESDLQAHLALIELNVTRAVHLTGLLLPAMVARGQGRILFTSSIAATMPGPYLSTYAASKAFLYSFTQAIRKELEGTGVVVTALMPGPTDTEFFTRAGMEDTRLGQGKKDDPADVARDGFEALMAGKDHVVAGSARNKAQVAAATILPDRIVASVQGAMSRPRSASR